MSDTGQEDFSPDIIPSISMPDVSMAVASVEGADWVREVGQDPVLEAAQVHFQVITPIHGNLREGQIITLPGRRVADPLIRVRHGFDAWNALSLAIGERVILAVRAANAQSGWIGVAAREISDQGAGEIEAVRRAYSIEEAGGDLNAKAGMLQSALLSGPRLLFLYALDFLRRHSAMRETAARILAGGMDSASPSGQKLEIGRALAGSDFFQRQAKADETNCRIISSLTKALVQDADQTRRAGWVQLLASCVLLRFTGDQAENREIRSKLAHCPGSPAASEVQSALSESEAAAAPDGKARVQELEHIWQTN